MHGQDRRMRRVGLPGNVCCAVIRLGAGLDMERLRQRIATSPIMDWLARVRIIRPLPLLPRSGAQRQTKNRLLRAQQSKWRHGDAVVAAPSGGGTRVARRAGAGAGVDVMRHADEPVICTFPGTTLFWMRVA